IIARVVAVLIGLANNNVGGGAAGRGERVVYQDAIVASVRDEETFSVGIGKAREGECCGAAHGIEQRSGYGIAAVRLTQNRRDVGWITIRIHVGGVIVDERIIGSGVREIGLADDIIAGRAIGGRNRIPDHDAIFRKICNQEAGAVRGDRNRCLHVERSGDTGTL